MTHEPGAAVLPTSGVIVGRRPGMAALRQALLALAPPVPGAADTLSRLRRVTLVDRQLGDWPLDDPAVLDALTGWLRQGGRRLVLLGSDFEATARALPRLARWRRDWQHAIDVLQPLDAAVSWPWRGLLAPPWCLQWLDAADGRLRVFADLTESQAIDAGIADFLQRCEPAWPATTLGL